MGITSGIQLVTGEIHPSELGAVSFSERLAFGPGARNPRSASRAFRTAFESLTQFRMLGGGTLVVRGVDSGYALHFALLLSQATEVNIAVVGEQAAEAAAIEVIGSSITEGSARGLFGSEVLPAAISLPRFDSLEQDRLARQRLVRWASQSRLPVLLMAEDATQGGDLVRTEGIPADHIILLGIDKPGVDLKAAIALAREGAFMCLGAAGVTAAASSTTYAREDTERVALIHALSYEADLGDRLLLGTATTLGHHSELLRGNALGPQYLMGEFKELMRAGGIDDGLIEAMLEVNPQRALMPHK